MCIRDRSNPGPGTVPEGGHRHSFHCRSKLSFGPCLTFLDTPSPESDLTLPALTPGLMLVHGNQPEMLRDLVVEWMKRYPLAPLENEIILVQSLSLIHI